MAIHPIEFRYGTPEMKRIWEEENKLQRMLDVESALAQAEGRLGIDDDSQNELYNAYRKDRTKLAEGDGYLICKEKEKFVLCMI